MNQKYFDKNEEVCKNKLLEFNNKHHLFSTINENKYKSSIDFTGTTNNGKKANIELKNRNYPSDRFNTLYIEAHKYAKLIIDYLYDDIEPIYLNFMNDGYSLLFNLKPEKLKHKPIFGEKKGIKSGGYDTIELSARIELDINDAYKYN